MRTERRCVAGQELLPLVVAEATEGLNSQPTTTERLLTSRIQMAQLLAQSNALSSWDSEVPTNAAQLTWEAAQAQHSFNARLSRSPHGHIARWQALRNGQHTGSPSVHRSGPDSTVCNQRNSLAQCCQHIERRYEKSIERRYEKSSQAGGSRGQQCWPSIPGLLYSSGAVCESASFVQEQDWAGSALALEQKVPTKQWVANLCDGSLATPHAELVKAAAEAVRLQQQATEAWCNEPAATKLAKEWASSDGVGTTELTKQVLLNSRVWNESKKGFPRILCYVPALAEATHQILDVCKLTWKSVSNSVVFGGCRYKTLGAISVTD